MLKLQKIKYPCQLFLLLLINFSSAAQEFKPHPLISPMWQVDGEGFVPSEIADTLRNGFTGASFQFRVPLLVRFDNLNAGGGKPFVGVFASASTGFHYTSINFLNPDRMLTTSRAGATLLYANGPSSLRNLYFLNGTTTLPVESWKFDPTHLRIHGTLVWRHLYHDNRLWHTLGVTYTPINGRDLVLPVIGFGYKINRENQFQFTFPFNMAYTRRFSNNFSLTFRLNSNGGYWYLRQDSLDKDVIYRQRYRKISITARYYTSRHVVFTPEAGITGISRVYIDEQKFTQAPSLYFKLSMQIRFGKRPAASPILNFDPGDSGFDPSYLLE